LFGCFGIPSLSHRLVAAGTRRTGVRDHVRSRRRELARLEDRTQPHNNGRVRSAQTPRSIGGDGDPVLVDHRRREFQQLLRIGGELGQVRRCRSRRRNFPGQDHFASRDPGNQRDRTPFRCPRLVCLQSSEKFPPQEVDCEPVLLPQPFLRQFILLPDHADPERDQDDRRQQDRA
jgi:hypothetical protein